MDRLFSRPVRWTSRWLALVFFVAATASAAGPDTPEVLPKPAPGSSQPPVSERPNALVEKARALGSQSRIPSAEGFLEMLHNPRPSQVELPPVSTIPMRGAELARRAASAHLRVGWIFRCSKCSNWHTNLAGGYAIAADTVVSAYHVLGAVPQNMVPGTGFPVIIRGEDDILPITAVLAADARLDTMILRILSDDLTALPLADKIEVGDPVCCLSDPFGRRGLFTMGIVNCLDGYSEGSADRPPGRRLIVSTDWAPGSSGSAVLDSFGNAVGHVDTIQALTSQKKPDEERKSGPESPAAVLTLHFAVSASSVRALLESCAQMAAPSRLKSNILPPFFAAPSGKPP